MEIGRPVELGSPEERTAVRVILIDPDDRILLFGARDPDDGRVVWVMPGGGIEQGETLEEAGRQEVREETGIEIGRLLGPVFGVASTSSLGTVVPSDTGSGSWLVAYRGTTRSIGPTWGRSFATSLASGG